MACTEEMGPLVVEAIRYSSPPMYGGRGDGERRQAAGGAGAGRLVHLPVHEHALALRQVVLVDDARLHHLVVEVVPFPSSFAAPGEHGEPAARLSHVLDELHEEHRLADAGAAEQADLAAAEIRREQVDDLDAGLERLDLHALLDDG